MPRKTQKNMNIIKGTNATNKLIKMLPFPNSKKQNNKTNHNTAKT